MTTDDGASALVFASDDRLSLLRPAHVVYVDATFRVVPSLYHQLFTIFVPHAEYAFPACFALMTTKTTGLYEAVLRKINTMESRFQPTKVIADFEVAPAAAMRNVYGDQLIVS